MSVRKRTAMKVGGRVVTGRVGNESKREVTDRGYESNA